MPKNKSERARKRAKPISDIAEEASAIAVVHITQTALIKCVCLLREAEIFVNYLVGMMEKNPLTMSEEIRISLAKRWLAEVKEELGEPTKETKMSQPIQGLEPKPMPSLLTKYRLQRDMLINRLNRTDEAIAALEKDPEMEHAFSVFMQLEEADEKK